MSEGGHGVCFLKEGGRKEGRREDDGKTKCGVSISRDCSAPFLFLFFVRFFFNLDQLRPTPLSLSPFSLSLSLSLSLFPFLSLSLALSLSIRFEFILLVRL